MKIYATVLLGPGTETSVGDAILSAADAVDGLILINSGGGGVAVEAAMAAADECGKPHVIREYAWTGDYGGARNAALGFARTIGCDYALTLDPDERLIDAVAVRFFISQNPETEVFLARDRDEGYFKERVLRCDSEVSWYGRVCEYLSGMTKPQVKMAVKFWELPKDDAAHRRRWERGVVECQRMIDEGDDRFRWRRHMGSCLMGLERRDEARAQYEHALKLADHDEERAWVWYLLCEQTILDGDFGKALLDASHGLVDHAGFLPEFGWIIAYSQLKLGNLQNASRWAQLAKDCPDDKTRVSFRGQNARSGCRDILKYIHSQPQKAAEFGLADWQKRREYAPNYRRLAAAVNDVLAPQNHLDLGSGQGLLVAAVAELGVETRGVELSESASEACPDEVRDMIKFGLGVDSWAEQPKADLVSCVEVLEHVPESEADKAVVAICSRSTRWVYFSAAGPGQPGKGHVNCQPKGYWRAKFEAHGFMLAEKETSALVAKIRDIQPCWWLPRNAMIFRLGNTEN